MSLWFSGVNAVAGDEEIVIRVHTSSLREREKEPVILRKMQELILAKKSPLTMIEEFPRDEVVIRAISNLLEHYIVTGTSGIHWNSDNGHSIHINTKLVKSSFVP